METGKWKLETGKSGHLNEEQPLLWGKSYSSNW
jgi:hypothetical protein